MIESLCGEGYALETGTGTSGTGVTYDLPFDSAPKVFFSMTASGSGDDGYIQTNNTNGHTLTTTTAKAYMYFVIGKRLKKLGR
jgi:hypothetical protein